MLRDKAVDTILARLGRSNDTARRQAVIDEMDIAISTTLSRVPVKPWFLVGEQTVSTTASIEFIDLGTSFIDFFEDGQVQLETDSGEWVELKRDDWDVIRKAYTDTESTDSRPESYDLVYQAIRMRPIPDKSYNLRFYSYMADTSIAGVYGDAANIENDFLLYAADLVIAETGRVIAEAHLQSPKMAVLFEKQRALSQRRLDTETVARMETLKQRFMEG